MFDEVYMQNIHLTTSNGCHGSIVYVHTHYTCKSWQLFCIGVREGESGI